MVSLTGIMTFLLYVMALVNINQRYVVSGKISGNISERSSSTALKISAAENALPQTNGNYNLNLLEFFLVPTYID